MVVDDISLLVIDVDVCGGGWWRLIGEVVDDSDWMVAVASASG